MGPAELLDFLNDLETRVPVAEWSAGDILVWPVIRLALPSRLLDSYIDLAKDAAVQARGGRAGQIVEAISGLARPMVAGARDRSHRPARHEPHDVVLLGDGVSQEWMGESWYDRLCEPFAEAFTKRGLTSLRLDPGRQPRVPRHSPSRFIQPVIDMARLRSRGATAASEHLVVPGYEQLVEAMARHQPDAPPLTVDMVARQVHQLRLLAQWFERMLAAQGARVGFVVDYLIHCLAFNLACARFGIESVEIQHGAQGPLHPVYSRWAAVPSRGYDLLPSSYWVWSATEADVIEPWALAVAPKHRAIAGGNLWLEAFRAPDSTMATDFDRQFQERTANEPQVLVALGFGQTTPEHLAPILAAIRARPTWRWWLRAHPAMTTAQADEARRTLSEVPGVRVESELSGLPLYAVLRNVDAALTIGSAVVVEAAMMGVPAVFTDTTVADGYRREIESGWVATASQHVADVLEVQMQRAADLPPYAPPRMSQDDALDMVLPPAATGGA